MATQTMSEIFNPPKIWVDALDNMVKGLIESGWKELGGGKTLRLMRYKNKPYRLFISGNLQKKNDKYYFEDWYIYFREG